MDDRPPTPYTRPLQLRARADECQERSKMLLPFGSGFGPFQQKHWPTIFGHGPLPTPSSFQLPINQLGSTAFRNGFYAPPMAPQFRNYIIQRPLGRPPLFPNVQIGDALPKIPDGVDSKFSLPPTPALKSPRQTAPKKIKIFRPWDDEQSLDAESKRRVSTSPAENSTTSTLSSPSSSSGAHFETRKRSDSTADQKPKISLAQQKKDDVDQSKSAFEIFATNLGKSPDGHRCIYCGKMYSRKYGLKIHLRTHTGFKPLKCKVCQRPFGDPSNLNKHVRLHADVLLPLSNSPNQSKNPSEDSAGHFESSQQIHFSVFKCPFCGRSLVRKRDLERHLASRHPNEHLVDVE